MSKSTANSNDEELPLEVLFILKRSRRIPSAWIQPVNSFSNHRLTCTCPLDGNLNSFYIVVHKNKLYDYSLKENRWYLHSCHCYENLFDGSNREKIEVDKEMEILGKTITASAIASNCKKLYLL